MGQNQVRVRVSVQTKAYYLMLVVVKENHSLIRTCKPKSILSSSRRHCVACPASFLQCR